MAYGYLAALFVLGVLVQVFLAGVGVFGINARKAAAAGDSNKWLGGAHALDGMIILLLSLWLAIAAWRRRSRSKES